MNVLIIGVGSIADKHIYAIKKINKNALIYGLRSSTSNNNKVNGVKNIYHLKDLPFPVDFVIISNPTFLHYKSITKSLTLDCPLFIEKPVLSSLKKIKYLASLIKTNNVRTYVACNLRFHPLIIFLKNFLKTKFNQINEVNVYCGSFLPEWRKNQNFRDSYSSKPEMGGGVHLDLIHEMDYCIWIFGFPNKVYSNKRSVSSLNIASVDSAIFILEYETFNVNIKLNYYRVDPKREIEILMSHETIVGDLLNNSLKSLNSNKVIYSNKYKIMDTYFEQMKYFLLKIKSEEQLMNDFTEATSILKLSLNE